ncbi:MAG: SpoIIE family protein phosphatase [Calditrichaeota bacterium]|nr:SpoIIE family protein phosphatase [Calditrichota bacterium]
MFKSVIKEEIQVPAHIDYLGELRNFVTKAGRKHGFSDTVINAFKLSIDEAATNIIKHAYRDWEGNIKMRVIIKKNSMTVLLIDQGKFFDPSRVKDPDLKRYVDIGKKGGLGIFIIRKLIDEIDYRHTEEGNELRLTKYRQTVTKKKKKLPTPTLPGSLKTRYTAIAAGILTTLLVLSYTYFFFHRSRVVFNEFVQKERPVTQLIANQVLKEGEIDLNPVYVDAKVRELTKDQKNMYRVVVTDAGDNVINSTDEKLFSQIFRLPKNQKIERDGLISYEDENGEKIYSFVHDVVYDLTGMKVGNVYYEFKESYLLNQIWALRFRDLQLALLILAFGYVGIIILVYVILNPFRKLANWIKELGSGDVRDEIDFEANDEVGEIAKAFSDITDTLRNSQKNLAEQERIQKEMQLAQDIQQTLLPAEVPQLEGYQIASFYEAAKEVGGDYYDFIEVDKDTLGIVVADVSGKGVPGSLIMTMIRTALRTEARSLKSASEVLARVNDFVVKDMKKGMFVTLFYIIIDSRRRRINYASAGHNPMILFRKSTNNTYYMNPRGFPVGISLPDASLFKKSIESDTIQLAEDDILILYTDGVTEAMNNRRELFGEERFLQVVRDYGHLGTNDFIEKLREEIHTFTEGHEQNDDITLVAIKETSSPEKIELKRAQKAHKMILQGRNIRDACEECGITVYAYYNKYKKIFEEEGVDAFELDETIAVEAKHMSIEEKTKIYDIIKKHPEYGAKRISEELRTEQYGFSEINENRIYDELVRSRLNTRQLREAYVARSGRKRRMKPPGTPMLTLDGKIILNKNYEEPLPEEPEAPPLRPTISASEKSVDSPAEEVVQQVEENLPDDLEDDFYLQSLMAMPLEDLLKKKHRQRREPETQDDEKISKESDGKSDEFFSEELDESQIKAESTSDKSEQTGKSLTADVDDLLQAAGEGAEELTVDDEDMSFRDIWEKELEEDVVFEEDVEEKDKNAEAAPEDDLASIEIPTTIDMDEILADVAEDAEKEDAFDLLSEETSFRDELLKETVSDEFEEVAPESNEENEIDDESFLDLVADDDFPELMNEIASAPVLTDQNMADEGSEEKSSFGFADLLEELTADISVIEESPDVLVQRKDDSSLQAMNFADEMEREIAREKDSNKARSDDMREDKNLLLGLKSYREKNYALAVTEFLKVLKKYPDFKEVHSILGNAHYHLGQIEEAISAYQKVKELDPRDTDSYENTGVIYANQGKFDEAIEEWEMVTRLDPQRKDILEHIREAKELLKNNVT